MRSSPAAFHGVGLPGEVPCNTPLTYSLNWELPASYTPVRWVHAPAVGSSVDRTKTTWLSVMESLCGIKNTQRREPPSYRRQNPHVSLPTWETAVPQLSSTASIFTQADTEKLESVRTAVGAVTCAPEPSRFSAEPSGPDT